MRYDTDPKVLAQQVVIETYKSSGPGGQRKNKTETAVRLTHLPSGITVIATEYRSQAQNRQLAFERLRERLLKIKSAQKCRLPTSVPWNAIEKEKERKEDPFEKETLKTSIIKRAGGVKTVSGMVTVSSSQFHPHPYLTEQHHPSILFY